MFPQKCIEGTKEDKGICGTGIALVDLSKYFDILNHDLLMNLLRRYNHDKRLIELIEESVTVRVMGN